MVRSIAPVEAPLQRTFVFENELVIAAGSVTVRLVDPEQPFASVTV